MFPDSKLYKWNIYSEMILFAIMTVSVNVILLPYGSDHGC